MRKFLVFSILAIILLSACGSDDGATRMVVNKALNNDGEISGEEWEEIKLEIGNSQKLSRDLTSDAKIEAFIQSMAKSKCRSGKLDCPIAITKSGGSSQPATTQKSSFNFYFENSASMDGYLNGNSDFKKALFRLLTSINGHDEQAQLKFINKEIKEVNYELSKFMDFLTIDAVRKNRAKGTSTDINQILETTTKQVLKDKKTAIVVSDFLYSISGQDVQAGLSGQQSATTLLFQNLKKRGDFAVLVIKCMSNFDGNYYDFKNPNKGKKIKIPRPYYIWVIGKKDEVLRFPSRYRISELEGYEDHALVYDVSSHDKPYFTVLPRTERVGSFRYPRGGGETINKITNLEPRKKEFQFSMLVDLGDLPLPASYLTDRDNYKITSDIGDDFELVDVRDNLVRDLDNNDKVKFKDKGTHILVLKTTERISPNEQKLNIQLVNNSPNWIQQSSTLDDTNIQSTRNKTFGLSYLLAGVEEAYVPKGVQSHFFDISIKMKK